MDHNCSSRLGAVHCSQFNFFMIWMDFVRLAWDIILLGGISEYNGLKVIPWALIEKKLAMKLVIYLCIPKCFAGKSWIKFFDASYEIFMFLCSNLDIKIHDCDD